MLSAFIRSQIKELISNSDYISRIRIQTTVDNKTDVSFLQDYKGDLSNVVLELPKTLKQNKEYIIFYIDGAKGNIEPLRGNESFIEVDNDDDSILKYIESVYEKPSVKKDNDSENSN